MKNQEIAFVALTTGYKREQIKAVAEGRLVHPAIALELEKRRKIRQGIIKNTCKIAPKNVNSNFINWLKSKVKKLYMS